MAEIPKLSDKSRIIDFYRFKIFVTSSISPYKANHSYVLQILNNIFEYNKVKPVCWTADITHFGC